MTSACIWTLTRRYTESPRTLEPRLPFSSFLSMEALTPIPTVQPQHREHCRENTLVLQYWREGFQSLILLPSSSYAIQCLIGAAFKNPNVFSTELEGTAYTPTTMGKCPQRGRTHSQPVPGRTPDIAVWRLTLQTAMEMSEEGAGE